MIEKVSTYGKPSVLCGWLFLFLPALLFTQVRGKISSVQFVGNEFFSQNELVDMTLLKTDNEFSIGIIDRSKSLILEMYKKQGFYNSTIDSITQNLSEDSANVFLTIYINEGIQTTIGSITFTGNKSFPSTQLTSLLESSTGNPLNERMLESDIQSILALYSNLGRPFAKIFTDSISIDREDSSKLLVMLVVDEGAKVFLNELQIEGNSSTKNEVIVREARLETMEPFQQEKSERIRRRLERMQLFSSVSQPMLYIAKAAAPDSLIGGLSISVKEGSANTFDGILGYIPANTPMSKGYFTGDVFVAFRNLFGTGRKALVKWKRESELTQELELQYREPWLFAVPLSINGTFFQRKQDSSYVKTKIEIRADFALDDELTLAASISNESIFPAADLQQFSVFESNILFFGGDILYDTRDNHRNPTNGIRYATSVQQGAKEITGPQKYLTAGMEKNYTMQKYSLDAEGYISTFLRQVVMVGVHGKQISSSRLELSDLYQFGGTTTLRGYRENQFFASKIAWMNVEYRFLTGRASSLYGFVDGGYFFRPEDVLKKSTAQEKSLYGYGFGARIETGLGILNVTYARGEGDTFSQGKIHVGIVNEF